ncbi:MAG: hypothetical protein KC646_14235 [Candidatus Cloacimonetes bacterium]|nr:hypothetical protein [Candidatus Cloacimonadota bacterium]
MILLRPIKRVFSTARHECGMLSNKINLLSSFLFFFCMFTTSTVTFSERQIIAEAFTSYHSFHSLDVRSEIYTDHDGTVLFENDDRNLWVKVHFSDTSTRSAIQAMVRIEYFEDVNFPKLPSKWVRRFNTSVIEGGSSENDNLKTYKRHKWIKLPSNLYSANTEFHRMKLVIHQKTKVKFGWAGRTSKKEKVFYLSPYPTFEGKRIYTKSVHKLMGWGQARNQILHVLYNSVRRLMDPTYKLRDGITPKRYLKKYHRRVNDYLVKFFDEVDFKAYMAEFITSYSEGLEEKIEFPVEWKKFLNIDDKDFNLVSLMPKVNQMMQGYTKNLSNHQHFLTLIRIVGSELRILEKLDKCRKLSDTEIERWSVFPVIESRNGFLDRINLLRKTSIDQQQAYEHVGQDVKRLLGWNRRENEWTPLTRTPIFSLANKTIQVKGKSEFVDPAVIEAVRGYFYSVFFVLAAENYYAKVFQELATTAQGIFQLSPPELTFSLDNELLFNGEEGVLIARVFNPSKYIALKNVHLLMEKRNLRRLIFYRGDNLQTIDLLKPQEVKYVFFRFSCIGIGTDYPSMQVRYNKDFKTQARVIPVAVMRKDEFLNKSIEKVERTTKKDVYNSYTSLKKKLGKFHDQLERKKAARRLKR